MVSSNHGLAEQHTFASPQRKDDDPQAKQLHSFQECKHSWIVDGAGDRLLKIQLELEPMHSLVYCSLESLTEQTQPFQARSRAKSMPVRV